MTTLTVKNLAVDHTSVGKDESYSFCRTTNCGVYFSHGSVLTKGDIKVRVGLKEQTDPTPLCYCFGYTRSDIQLDVELRSSTDIPNNRIKAEIQAGFCACQVKNPSGACCLGDITRAIQEAKTPNDKTVPASR